MVYKKPKPEQKQKLFNGEMFRLACCDCGLVHEFKIDVPGLKKGAVVLFSGHVDGSQTKKRREGYLRKEFTSKMKKEFCIFKIPQWRQVTGE